MPPRSAVQRLWHRLTSPAEPAGDALSAQNLAPIPDRPGSAATWPDRTPHSEGEELHLEEIRRAYAAWVPYEREPRSEETSALKVHLNWFLSHPSEAMDRFCEQVLAEITEDSDVFWVNEAVRHASFAFHPEHAVQLLEGVLRDRALLRAFDLLMPSAASKLGAKAAYPNALLAERITLVDPDADPEYLRELHCTTYGGYISTATGFQPGFDERLRVQASGETLSVEKAERFIARWRAEHADETPPLKKRHSPHLSAGTGPGNHRKNTRYI